MTDARRSAGLLAAGVTLIAAAPLSAAAWAAPVRATPTHVAIVVAGEGQACVPWHSGMNGADVLDAAGYEVTWGRQSPYIGFVLQINGHGTLRPDDEHYWSYWQDTGTGWAYSSRGSASTTVQPGTVEGWSYVNGQSSATAPPTTDYAQVCAGQDPSPAPTRHPSTHPHAPRTSATHSRPSTTTPSRTTRHHRAPAPTSAAATTMATAPPGTTATPTTSGARTPRTTAASTTPGAATPSTTTAAPTSRPAAAATGTPAPHTASEHTASEHTAALPSWTTALALLVVLAVGATAMVRIRRSRR